MNRLPPFISVAVALVLALSACSPGAATAGPVETANAADQLPLPTVTQEMRPIRVCYTGVTGTQAVTLYAYENGIFEKYGLQVELAYINSGTRAVMAILADSEDICQLAGAAIVNAVAAGQDAVMIAGLYNVYPASFYVSAEVTEAQDLVGQAVAVSQPGSSTDVASRMVLTYLGLQPDVDVAIISLGEEASRMAGMQAGQVAGTILTTPAILTAQELGFHELVNLGDLGIPYQHTGIGTSRGFIQSHPQEVTDFMQAILEAIAQMKTDPEGTKAVMAKYMEIDATEYSAELEDAYQSLVLNNLEIIPYPTLPGIQTIIDYLSVSNPTMENITPEQAVDTSSLDALRDRGVFTLP